MRPYANTLHQATIKQMTLAGATAEEISNEVKVELPAVKNFMSYYKAEANPEDPDVVASDAAVKLADENDVDLAEVKGTGANGNITKYDVEQFIADRDENNE